MRTLLIGFSAIIIILIAMPVDAQITKNTDEFTGKTTYKSEEPRVIDVEDGEAFRALYMPMQTEEFLGMAIYSVGSESTIEYSNKTVYFLIDGERMSKKVAQRDSDYESSAIVDYVVVVLSEDEFSRVGEAETVRVKVGSNVFNMPYDKRNDIRLIAQELN